MSNNILSAVNQQGTLNIFRDSSETTRRAPFLKKEIIAYLQGALHDATLNKKKRFRFAQKNKNWLEFLKFLFKNLGYNSWIYKKGKHRNIYILETLANFLDFRFNPLLLKNEKEQIEYVKGFFDTEGGIPHKQEDKFYIQLVQKDKIKLEKIKKILLNLNIKTGVIHNPSIKIDKDYWRMYILTNSHKEFVKIINSWHPEKKKIFQERMVI